MPYITHGYGKHVCFKIYFRSTLFSAHGNFFWQNSEWVPVVRAPLKREAAPLKGIHSPLRMQDSSAGDDGASGANGENLPAFMARHRLLFLGKETASHNCFLGGRWAGQMLVQKCDDTAWQQPLWVPGLCCMLAPSETAKILLRHWSQIHCSRDWLSVGNLHVFLERDPRAHSFQSSLAKAYEEI